MALWHGMTDKEYGFCENVAAIAMEFGASPKYNTAYKKAAHSGGFPVFYRIAINAAMALDRAEKKLKIHWGDNADWVITIETLAKVILSSAIAEEDFPSQDELNAMAEESINWN